MKDLKKEAKKVIENEVIMLENDELEAAWARGEKPLNDKGKPRKLRKLKEIKDVPDPELKDVQPWSPIEQLNNEKVAVGFFLSSHPFESYKEKLGGLEASIPLSKIDTMTPETGDSYLVCGVISAFR